MSTLLERAEKVPSGKRKEMNHVVKVLMDNNEPLWFIKSCDSYRKANHRVSNSNTSNEVKCRLLFSPLCKA